MDINCELQECRLAGLSEGHCQIFDVFQNFLDQLGHLLQVIVLLEAPVAT